jgi:hypothetical protein
MAHSDDSSRVFKWYSLPSFVLTPIFWRFIVTANPLYVMLMSAPFATAAGTENKFLNSPWTFKHPFKPTDWYQQPFHTSSTTSPSPSVDKLVDELAVNIFRGTLCNLEVFTRSLSPVMWLDDAPMSITHESLLVRQVFDSNTTYESS